MRIFDLNTKAISRQLVIIALVGIIAVGAIAGGYWYFSSPAQLTDSETLNVGVVLFGHHDLGSWDPAQASTVTDLIDQGYDINVLYSEETQVVDAEDVIRNRARIDDLVLVTSFIFSDGLIKVAKEFPDVAFVIQEEGNIPASKYGDLPNVIFYNNKLTFLESFFLVGACAGEMTETNKMGAAFPMQIPGHAPFIRSIMQGADQVNPNVETSYAIMGTFSDPIKARDTAASFIESGCDVVVNFMDDEAIDEEARSRGVYSVHLYRDVRARYPDSVIANTVWKQSVWFKEVVEEMQAGTWKEYFAANRNGFDLDMKSGAVDVVWGSIVPSGTVEVLESLKTDIKEGRITIPYNLDDWP